MSYGTWELVKDKFLVGAGNSYSNGSTGGEATHILSGDEIPVHTHHLKTYDAGGVAGGGGYIPAASYTVGSVIVHTGSNETGTAGTFTDRTANGVSKIEQMTRYGGSLAHNNLPPYLAVNIYKRTA